MAGAENKNLRLTLDASTELLKKEMGSADQVVEDF
jgi:hypothetical protein